MARGWHWRNLFNGCCKTVKCSCHSTHLLDAGVELFAEAFGVEVPEDDPAEDGRHGGAGEQVDVQRVEVSDEATCGKGNDSQLDNILRPMMNGRKKTQSQFIDQVENKLLTKASDLGSVVWPEVSLISI